MITNRPMHLLNDPAYCSIPAGPFGLDLSSVPDWIKLSMLGLGGVQPITTEMVEAAHYVVSDEPTLGELELYERKGTRFQSVSVVNSVAAFHMIDGVCEAIPYAISLIPSNRRGTELSIVDVDYVRRIDLNSVMASQSPVFVGLDPFAGDWAGWGAADLVIDFTPRPGFADELGLVTDMYFLQLDYEPDSVCGFNFGMDEGRTYGKYMRRRSRLLFTPFVNTKARRIWGAESPIELFLLQGLLREGLSPTLQMLLFDDGSTYPSIDHLWAEGLDEIPGFITEADMYFPEQRVAVFCDSTRHHRGKKAAAKDSRITQRLDQAGIRSVRVPGALIVHDLQRAIELVRDVVR